MKKFEIRMNLPNLISFGRLLAVPVCVWLILDANMRAAFWVFAVACLSDAVDGFIAKKFDSETVLGGYLDPIADKALLVSVFIALGQTGRIESWLVILVVFRDAVIILGAYLYHLLYQRLSMQPLLISKINTAAQFVLAAAVLGIAGFGLDFPLVTGFLVYLVAATTLASGAAYTVKWTYRAVAMEPGD
jgi:cardiolipin synthase